MRKLKFWKLEIKFGNRNFEKLFKNGSLKIKFKKMEFWRIIWGLNLKINNKINIKIEILKIRN